MICCSLRHRGEELLAQVGGLAEYEHDGHTMGIPLLYPWANRLAAFDYGPAGAPSGSRTTPSGSSSRATASRSTA